MAITDLIPWKREEEKAPVRREEEHPMQVLQRDMNRLFDEFSRGFSLGPFGAFDEPWEVFGPRINVVESDKELKVSAELPGMDEKDIEVTLSRDLLTLSGEKTGEKEDKGKNYYRMERSYGSFRRSISIPCEIDADKVEATLKKGVLTVTLPKKVGAQPCRTITVKYR